MSVIMKHADQTNKKLEDIICSETSRYRRFRLMNNGNHNSMRAAKQMQMRTPYIAGIAPVLENTPDLREKVRCAAGQR